VPIDGQSADLYLTDLPVDAVLRLSEGDASVLSEPDVVGSIVHIHLFLLPRAGRTPIDFNANNVTITHLVFAGVDEQGEPVIGQYGGGGFLLPNAFRGELEDNRFDGVMRRATMAYLRGTASFADRLDGAEASGSLSFVRDEPYADALAAAVRRVVNAMPR
jgi:hypothetical protein